jgi:hypothetical protein
MAAPDEAEQNANELKTREAGETAAALDKVTDMVGAPAQACNRPAHCSSAPPPPAAPLPSLAVSLCDCY